MSDREAIPTSIDDNMTVQPTNNDAVDEAPKPITKRGRGRPRKDGTTPAVKRKVVKQPSHRPDDDFETTTYHKRKAELEASGERRTSKRPRKCQRSTLNEMCDEVFLYLEEPLDTTITQQPTPSPSLPPSEESEFIGDCNIAAGTDTPSVRHQQKHSNNNDKDENDDDEGDDESLGSDPLSPFSSPDHSDDDDDDDDDDNNNTMDRMGCARPRYEGIPSPSPSLSPQPQVEEHSTPARVRSPSPPLSPAPAVPVVSAPVVPVPSPAAPSVPVIHDPFLDALYGVTPTPVPAVDVNNNNNNNNNRVYFEYNRMHLDSDPLSIGAELMDELAVGMGYFNGEVYVW